MPLGDVFDYTKRVCSRTCTCKLSHRFLLKYQRRLIIILQVTDFPTFLNFKFLWSYPYEKSIMDCLLVENLGPSGWGSFPFAGGAVRKAIDMASLWYGKG